MTCGRPLAEGFQDGPTLSAGGLSTEPSILGLHDCLCAAMHSQLSRTIETWLRTVFSAIPSRSAIVLLSRPCATNSRTLCSRAESSLKRCSDLGGGGGRHKGDAPHPLEGNGCARGAVAGVEISFDEGQRPSHVPRRDHQYDHAREQQTQHRE
jgi:hypothetical protein